MGLSQVARQDISKIQQRKQLFNDEIKLKSSQQWVLYHLLTGVPDKNWLRGSGSRKSLLVDNSVINHNNVRLQIQDAAGLMGLYYYRYKPFEALLTNLVSRSKATQVAAQLKDWVDADSLVSHQGLEAAEYIKSGQKMLPRNGAIRSLDELLELPGMNKSLFNGDKKHPGLKELLLAGGVTEFNVSTAPDMLIGPMLGLHGSQLAQVLALKKSQDWGRLQKIIGSMSIFYDSSSPFDQAYQYRIIMTLDSGVQARSLVRLTPSKERPYRFKIWQYPDNDRG